MYVFAEDITLEPLGETTSPMELAGPTARETLRKALGADPGEPTADHSWHAARIGGGDVVVSSVEVAGSAGWRVDAGHEGAQALWTALLDAGATPVGRIVHDSLRVEAGAARFGVDYGEEIYPQEARLERAFALDKGCYIGQEVVAKIDTYQGLNKRLVTLRFASDDPIPAGARLLFDEDGEQRDLGVVTSWAYSFALDGGAGLGYVKRRHQAAGTRFTVALEDGTPLCEAELLRPPLREGALAPTGDFE
jgi:folate-binding protein YgfZ